MIHKIVKGLAAGALFCGISLGSAWAGTADTGLIRFFQAHISQVDGDRCPMAPSCSSYARQAFEKHGPLMGWIMTCDRLVRCGRDEVRLAPQVTIQGETYTWDPVEANDFWWFEETECRN